MQLPYGDFTARLVELALHGDAERADADQQPGAVQRRRADADARASRLRWEYTGGSELFVVYSDGRDTAERGFPALLNRTFAIKATRLFRF